MSFFFYLLLFLHADKNDEFLINPKNIALKIVFVFVS